MDLALRKYNCNYMYGWPYAPEGAVCGPEINEELPPEGSTELLYQNISPLFGAQDLSVVINRAGKYETTDDADGAFQVEPSADGNGYDSFDLWSVQTAASNVNWEGHAYLWARPVGPDRVRLTWEDEPDESDFKSYIIYWDEGDGEDADVELVEISRRALREHTTGSLASGTYKFLIEYRDRFGNETAIGAPVSAIVYAAPEKPTLSSYSFDGVTSRAFTFSLDTSEEVWIWSNYLLGYGQADYIQFEHPLGIKRSGGVTYTTQRLWAGRWKFAFTRRNQYGNDGEPDYLYTRLVESGGALVEIIDFGDPWNLRAQHDSDAKIDLSWQWTGESNANTYTEIWVSAGGGAYTLETTTQSFNYEFQGVDDVEYTFKLRSKYTDGTYTDYGEYSGAVTITADGTAPTGDHVLAAEVIY